MSTLRAAGRGATCCTRFTLPGRAQRRGLAGPPRARSEARDARQHALGSAHLGPAWLVHLANITTGLEACAPLCGGSGGGCLDVLDDPVAHECREAPRALAHPPPPRVLARRGECQQRGRPCQVAQGRGVSN